MSDEIQRRLHLSRKLRCRSVTVDMHIENMRLIPEEVIVKCCDLQAVVEKRRHDRIDLILKKHKVSHHHFHSHVTLGHCEPASEAKRSRGCDTCDADLQIIA